MVLTHLFAGSPSLIYDTGVPKRQVVTLAAKTLAGQYQESIQRNSTLIEKSVTL